MKTGNVKNEVESPRRQSAILQLTKNGIKKSNPDDAIVYFKSVIEKAAKRTWFKQDKDKPKSKTKYDVPVLMRKYNKGLTLSFDELNHLKKLNKIE